MAIVVGGVKLDVQDWRRLKNASKVAQELENKWDRRVAGVIARYAKRSADQITAGAEIEVPDFETLFIEHYFDVSLRSLQTAESENELDKRLARVPRSLADIRKLYDRWRKGLWKPRSIVKRAKEIKELYVSSVQKAWKKYSEDFRTGGEQTQEEIINKIRKAAEVPTARAQTIVRTSTTQYYNEVRKTYYDASRDVTHYLFLAVRDKATTKWCTSEKRDGLRGRSGLVYAKDDPLLKAETPAIHWNCRSELLPLTPMNPSHRRMIEDPSMQRRNHKCHPLPPGWSK